MSAAQPPGPMRRQAELAKSAWERIRAHLEDKAHQLYEEIKQYPRPIPACDQQFNFLLEERARLSQALDQMEEASRASLTQRDPLGLIDAFITSCSHMDVDTGQQIRSLLKEDHCNLGRAREG